MHFPRRYLDLADVCDTTPANLRRFVGNFLRADGVFILRMVHSHAGQIMCTEITQVVVICRKL